MELGNKNYYIADTHVHSKFSDGLHSPWEILKQAKKAGLNVVALTDHDTTAGITPQLSEKAQKLNIGLIRACEITTAQGHLIALDKNNTFPNRPFEEFYSLADTVEVVSDYGGIILIPHLGFCISPGSVAPATLNDLYQTGRHVSAIETAHPSFNTRHTIQALQTARQYNIAEIGVSDDHWGNVGRKFVTHYPKMSGDPVKDFFAALDKNTTRPEVSKYHPINIPFSWKLYQNTAANFRGLDRKIPRIGRLILTHFRLNISRII